MGQCLDILQAIIDNENYFPVEEWRNVPKSSVGMYTKCLSILKENGLVQKRNGHYMLSNDLISVLEKIADRWSELINSVERGERLSIK